MPATLIHFPLTREHRLRIALRRLATALEAQAEAMAGLRTLLAAGVEHDDADRVLH